MPPVSLPPPTSARWPQQYRSGRLAACLLWLGALAACAAEPLPVAAQQQPGAPRLALVQTLIGTAACQADTECRTVAIGYKACGGPEGYLAWSATGTDADALARAVADHNAARQAAQAADGRVSNCQFVVDPGALCRAAATGNGGTRTCQLQTPAGRNGLSSR